MKIYKENIEKKTIKPIIDAKNAKNDSYYNFYM